MPSERDALRRALGRLGRVPPEVLSSSRQRVRQNLKIDLRLPARLPPPDATPADLTPLRRPFYIGTATALLCLVIAGGAAIRWRPEQRPTSAVAPKTASPQASVPQASIPQAPAPPTSVPSPSSSAVPPSVAPAPPQPRSTPPSTREVQSPPEPAPVRASLPRVQFALLPPGGGKVILDRACGACHRAAAVGLYHYATRAQYAEVVSRMIAMGAQVSEQEAPVLTGYLFDNLAAKPAPDLDTAGPAILERACTGCHSLNDIESYSYDTEAPYTELVSTMVSYGATLSEVEKATLIRYLFKTYGKR